MWVRQTCEGRPRESQTCVAFCSPLTLPRHQTPKTGAITGWLLSPAVAEKGGMKQGGQPGSVAQTRPRHFGARRLPTKNCRRCGSTEATLVASKPQAQRRGWPQPLMVSQRRFVAPPRQTERPEWRLHRTQDPTRRSHRPRRHLARDPSRLHREPVRDLTVAKPRCRSSKMVIGQWSPRRRQVISVRAQRQRDRLVAQQARDQARRLQEPSLACFGCEGEACGLCFRSERWLEVQA